MINKPSKPIAYEKYLKESGYFGYRPIWFAQDIPKNNPNVSLTKEYKNAPKQVKLKRKTLKVKLIPSSNNPLPPINDPSKRLRQREDWVKNKY